MLPTMRFFLGILLCGLSLFQTALTADVEIGSSYADVIAALGEPDGDLEAGSRRILSYGQAQIKLKDGKVNSISRDLEQRLAERNADQATIEAKRAAGLVNYKGKWMRPSERDQLIASERKAAVQAASNRSTSGWITDYDLALSLAKSQNKQVLLNFTGSDWCGWCIKLDKEVFSQKVFLKYAQKHYVLVKLDFPRRSQLPGHLKRQNERLAKEYKVRGFPTVVVLNANGKKHKTGGYVRGGPEAFIRSLQ